MTEERSYALDETVGAGGCVLCHTVVLNSSELRVCSSCPPCPPPAVLPPQLVERQPPHLHPRHH